MAFEVFELHDPAKIVTDFRSMPEEQKTASVFSVRTASVSQDKPLETNQQIITALEEEGGEQVRTLHSANHTIFVEEGYYSTLEQAEKRVAELEETSFDFELFIEKRHRNEFPGVIE